MKNNTLKKNNTILNNNFKILFFIIIVLSLVLRLFIFLYTDFTKHIIGVAASHTDIALGIMNSESFSFNVERHLWIENNLDSLTTNPIKNPPSFSNSDRAPIGYMDPGYGIFIGYLFKILNSPLDFDIIRLGQILLDIILLFLIFDIGRMVGLSKLSALIPVIIHGFNILLLRPVFELVQDHLVVFLIVFSIWLILKTPNKKRLKYLQYITLFLMGGIIPWVRSLFLLYPLFFLSAVILFKILKRMPNNKYLIIGSIFFLGSIILYLTPRNYTFNENDLSFSFGRPGCLWYSFYGGLHQFDDGPRGDELMRPLVMELDPSLKEKPIISSWTKMDSLLKPIFIKELKSSPLNYLVISTRRFFIGLFPCFYDNYSNRLNIPYIIIFCGRFILLIISMTIIFYAIIEFRLHAFKPSLILLIPWIYIVLVSTPLALQGRSLMPTIDLLVIFFTLATVNIYKKYGNKFVQK